MKRTDYIVSAEENEILEKEGKITIDWLELSIHGDENSISVNFKGSPAPEEGRMMRIFGVEVFGKKILFLDGTKEEQEPVYNKDGVHLSFKVEQEGKMRKYIGKKEINARPMSRGEYHDFRGWELPASENYNEEGYLVEHVGGGKNTKRYDGYVSWLPKDVFEKTYRASETVLDRLKIEYEDLEERHKKLVAFLQKNNAAGIVGDTQYRLLDDQEGAMLWYLSLLEERLKLMEVSERTSTGE